MFRHYFVNSSLECFLIVSLILKTSNNNSSQHQATCNEMMIRFCEECNGCCLYSCKAVFTSYYLKLTLPKILKFSLTFAYFQPFIRGIHFIRENVPFITWSKLTSFLFFVNVFNIYFELLCLIICNIHCVEDSGKDMNRAIFTKAQ